MALLDEAMASVIAGEVSSLFTGVIYCSVLDACLDLTDLGRASEWNEAALAWCDTLPPDAPFTALCQAVARRPQSGRADLHVHTTFSDGSYTPPEIISLFEMELVVE